QAGWTVPRLDDRRVVPVEVLDVLREASVAFPRRRHEHTERMQHVATAAFQQVQRFVEACRIRAFGPDDGPQLSWQARLSRVHPGAIAEQGIDLTVVGQQAEWLRELPGGKRIGGITLVKYRQGAFVVRTAQVEVERWQLVRGEESFVDERATRQTGDV